MPAFGRVPIPARPPEPTVKWRHPDKVSARFKVFIEGACRDCGIYPLVTSDWRDPDANPGVKNSRHLWGEAVDFDIPLKGHGAIVGQLLVALIVRATAMLLLNQLEVEIVASEKDSHLHVALDPSQKVVTILAAAD
jgi:hypothetical protein